MNIILINNNEIVMDMWMDSLVLSISDCIYIIILL